MDLKIRDRTTVFFLVSAALIDQIGDFMRGHPSIIVIKKDILYFFMKGNSMDGFRLDQARLSW